MICPKCRKWIPDGSREHKTAKCNWTVVSDLLNKVKCGCGNDAATRIKIEGKWVPVCRACDDNRRRDEARAFCEANGLKTRADCLAYIKKTMSESRLFKGAPIPRQREPGDDEEYRLS